MSGPSRPLAPAGGRGQAAGDYGAECVIELASGRTIRTDSAEASPDGSTYVRVCEPDGSGITYWTSDEWQEEPELVMGAILGAARHGAARR